MIMIVTVIYKNYCNDFASLFGEANCMISCLQTCQLVYGFSPSSLSLSSLEL